MNIKEAKGEIKKAVQIYLEKDADGEYLVPTVRQRPIFLVGAPGIGKTAIMEQIAAELDIALVSYAMTHHTRQSAIGLPVLEEVTYGGKKYTKSEYTMSEIIASVYDVIEKTGKKEGILFLDEINCVSETLAPSMLLFLQYKRFGAHTVPDGWVIVTAGNPPQFNKSVKEFDVATMDRMKVIKVDESFAVWKEYAYNAGVHPAIISFLELNEKWFYKINTTVDGKTYITARGWEDLSSAIQAYERNGFPVTTELISEYIADIDCARKFSTYYDLFKKYRVNYSIQEVLDGKTTDATVAKANRAKFDERLSIISMLMEGLGTMTKEVVQLSDSLQDTVKRLRVVKKNYAKSPKPVFEMVKDNAEDIRAEMAKQKAANALSSQKKEVMTASIKQLESYHDQIQDISADNAEQFKVVQAAFKKDTKALERKQKKVSDALEAAFEFVEKAWSEDQEMTLFTTEVTASSYIASFIARYGCPAYYRHNAALLVYDEEAKLQDEIEGFLNDGESELPQVA